MPGEVLYAVVLADKVSIETETEPRLRERLS
jgi:hypothetical protein